MSVNRDNWCSNCYDHCAKCYEGEAKAAILTGNPQNLSNFFDDITDSVKSGGTGIQSGDILIWTQRNHWGLATGKGDIVSQCGYTLRHWELLRKNERGELTSEEAAEFEALQINSPNDLEVNAGDLSKIGELGDYRVYRIKKEWLGELICKHLRKVSIGVSWKDVSKDFRFLEPATYYQVEFKCRNDTWTRSVRSPGSRSHYGCLGFKTFDLPQDVADTMSTEEMRARAEQASGLEFAEPGPEPAPHPTPTPSSMPNP